MKQWLHPRYCLTFKSYSATKFVAHLITSFNSYLRDYPGLVYLWNSNLNWKQQIGRANLWHKNITQSADLYIGESFVKDSLNLFVIPISKLAQSNLFPIYKFPKLVDQTLQTLDYHIDTLTKDIANDNNKIRNNTKQ